MHAVTSTYRYDAFGNELNGNSPAYGYTGKWQRDLDSTTGTIHMGARGYDPALGRFTSADPLKGIPADPPQRNRYTYTSNNPLTRYDLAGLSWATDWLSALPGSKKYADKYSDQERTRTGADGNGFKACGCKSSGSTELNQDLIPESGTGIQVGMFKYEETDEYRGDYRLYEVRDISGNTLTVSAENPYLEEFALNVKIAGVASNYALLSGFTSWFTSTFLMDIYSGIFDTGPDVVSYRAENATMYFEMMEMWEEKCT